MSNYWVGKQTNGDNAIVVYDPNIQISDKSVYLFNKQIACMEHLDRVQARAIFKKVTLALEQEAAIKAYQEWLETHAGKQFSSLIKKFQNGPEIPNYLYKLYRAGYRDGHAGYDEREFDARMPEICRREYNRGYIDGANDLAVEQSLCVPNDLAVEQSLCVPNELPEGQRSRPGLAFARQDRNQWRPEVHSGARRLGSD